jgi:hypothetical protein
MPHPRSAVVLVCLLVAPTLLAGQNQAATSGVWGGASMSRFVPLDVLNRMRERPDALEDAFTVTARMDSAWGALRTTLTDLGVELSFEDPASGELGNAQLKLRRRLGKQPLSSLVRCGSGSTGPNADTYLVYLTVVAFVKPIDNGIAILPLVTGHAINPEAGRSDAVDCTSTGRLEKRIGEGVRARLSGAGGR